MTKGLKMDSARKKNAGANVFNISCLNKSGNGNLKCKFCDAEVQYISAHAKIASKTPVSAYLKLWQGERHDEYCGYSVKGAVDQLVAGSNAIEDVSPIFELQKNGSYLFRMNILVEALSVAEELSSCANVDNELERKFSGRDYVRTGRHLASYFRSASGIARLRGLIQESSDVEVAP